MNDQKDENTKITLPSWLSRKQWEKLLELGIDPNIPLPEIDYGIITDAIGFAEEREEWESLIGKPPPLEDD
jgi:hypothetical protein